MHLYNIIQLYETKYSTIKNYLSCIMDKNILTNTFSFNKKNIIFILQ